MTLRCHFDSGGWLQGPIKITHMTQLTPNRYNSGFATKARGMALHTEDGFEAGTRATFMNAAAKVSAFVSVGEDGEATQYLPVGHGYRAWAQEDGNDDWRSCECEDKTKAGVPMPPPQLTTVAQVLEAFSEYDQFPLQITDDPHNGHGLITHGDGGVSWGNHPNCPGSVRKAQRPKIIALAMSIRAEGTPPKGPFRHTAPGGRTLGQIAAARGTTAQHLAGVSAAAYTDRDVTVLAGLPLPAGAPYYTAAP